MLDSGRGLERALQVVALLRVTPTRARPVEVERPVFDAVLTASESILTFRRRYRGRTGVEAVVELLVTDGYNPRSVAYQLAPDAARPAGDPQHLADRPAGPARWTA